MSQVLQSGKNPINPTSEMLMHVALQTLCFLHAALTCSAVFSMLGVCE